MSPDVITKALRGPWQTVLSSHAFVAELAEIGDYEPDDLRVSIVRGTAAPEVDPHEPTMMRMPWTWTSGDQLVEWDDFEEYDEVRARYAQAQAMTDGLNAAGGAS